MSAVRAALPALALSTRALLVALMAATPASAHPNHTPFETPGDLWRLVELDGKPFEARATLRFPRTGRIEGEGPCNRWFGTMWSAYPWFRPEGIASTRQACPDLALETAFLAALGHMNFAEAVEGVLILTGDDGASMVFRRAESRE